MLTSSLSIPISLLLVFGLIYSVAKTIQRNSLTVRVNHLLHGFMGFGMLGMVWHQFQPPIIIQLLLFAVAAYWFVLQAVAHADSWASCRSKGDRFKSGYYAIMMAAMVLMLAMMASVESHSFTTVTVKGNHGHGHHSDNVTTAVSGMPGSIPEWHHAAGIAMTILFAVATVVWVFLTVKPLHSVKFRADHPRVSAEGAIVSRSPRQGVAAGHVHEAATALTMAVMFGAHAM